jgi:hypothetical protein
MPTLLAMSVAGAKAENICSRRVSTRLGQPGLRSSPSFAKPFATPAYPPCTSEPGLLCYAFRYFAGLPAWCTPGDLADGAPIYSRIFPVSKSFVQFGQLRRCSLIEVSRVKSSNNLISAASFSLQVSVCRGRKRGGCRRQHHISFDHLAPGGGIILALTCK